MYWYHPDHLGSSSFITGLDGEVTLSIDYFPSGEVFVETNEGGSPTFWRQNHKNSYNTPYKFNGKEQDSETGYYYYGARYYNPRVSLWLNVDPLVEKHPDYSPYAYCANNPIKLIDPDGRDFTLVILGMFRKDRTVSKMEIRATVYITGSNASAARTKELNTLAKETFKSGKVDGAEVGIKVKYIYKKDIDQKDLKPGENILNFVDKTGRSGVEGTIADYGSEIFHYTGNVGTIYSNADNMAAMHETGHFIGLPDRYKDIKDKNGNVIDSKPNPSFVGDLMGDKEKN